MSQQETIDTSVSVVRQRCFAAPIDDVWAALTNPRFVVLWYGGHGFKNPRCEMDVRSGGRWSHLMRTPDGAEHALQFVFDRVSRPNLLAWSDARHGGGPVNIVRLATVDAGTMLSFEAAFPTPQSRMAAIEHGFETVLDEGFERMANVLRVFHGLEARA